MVETTSRPFGTSVALIAKKNNDGTLNENLKTVTPYQLIFKTPDAIKNRFSSEQPDSYWYEDIKSSIDQGEVLYEVFAYRPATTVASEEEIKIANVRLNSLLFTSNWGDEHLYFRHHRIGRDRGYWPKDLKELDEDPFFNM